MNISVQNEAPMTDVVLNVERLCAWCLSEQGITAGEGSHGICKEHAEKMLLQWRAEKERNDVSKLR